MKKSLAGKGFSQALSKNLHRLKMKMYSKSGKVLCFHRRAIGRLLAKIKASAWSQMMTMKRSKRASRQRRKESKDRHTPWEQRGREVGNGPSNAVG